MTVILSKIYNLKLLTSIMTKSGPGFCSYYTFTIRNSCGPQSMDTNVPLPQKSVWPHTQWFWGEEDLRTTSTSSFNDDSNNIFAFLAFLKQIFARSKPVSSRKPCWMMFLCFAQKKGGWNGDHVFTRTRYGYISQLWKKAHIPLLHYLDEHV